MATKITFDCTPYGVNNVVQSTSGDNATGSGRGTRTCTRTRAGGGCVRSELYVPYISLLPKRPSSVCGASGNSILIAFSYYEYSGARRRFGAGNHISCSAVADRDRDECRVADMCGQQERMDDSIFSLLFVVIPVCGVSVLMNGDQRGRTCGRRLFVGCVLFTVIWQIPTPTSPRAELAWSVIKIVHTRTRARTQRCV